MNVVRRMRGWATISAGDCLRECRKERPESEDAKIIEGKISKGEIVPAEITVKLLNDKVEMIGFCFEAPLGRGASKEGEEHCIGSSYG